MDLGEVVHKASACCGPSPSPTASRDESVAPSNRIHFETGKIGDNSSSTISASSVALATGAATVLLRVIWVKSAHFALSVTVLPRMPLAPQSRQTLPMSDCRQARAASMLWISWMILRTRPPAEGSGSVPRLSSLSGSRAVNIHVPSIAAVYSIRTTTAGFRRNFSARASHDRLRSIPLYFIGESANTQPCVQVHRSFHLKESLGG